MFVVCVTLTLQANHRDSFRDYAGREGLQARNMPGCVEYSFCEDVADPLRVLLYEEWATREDFEEYKSSPFFSATNQRLKALLCAPPKSAYYVAEDVFGL